MKKNKLIISQLFVVYCLAAPSTQASVISNNAVFTQLGTSMWGPSNNSSLDAKYLNTAFWDETLARTDLLVGHLDAHSDGGVSMTANASAYGGGVDLQAYVNPTLVLPDEITQGNAFTIGTSGGLNSNLTRITANAPSFSASIGGGLTARASFEFDGKWFIPDANAKLKADFGFNEIISFDSGRDPLIEIAGVGIPATVYDKEYHIRGTPGALILDVDSKATIIPGKPIIGDLELHQLQNITGGTVTGNSVALTTNQQILSLGLSVPGMFEMLNHLPGILQNSISLAPGVTANYKLADFEIGPTLGIEQTFGFDTDLKLELLFDKPVTQLFSNNSEHTHQNGRVLANLGDDLNLMFNNEVGNFIGYNLFMDNATLSNNTSMTIDPFMEFKGLCLKLSPGILSETCLFDWREQTQGLVNVDMFEDTWALDGFQSHSFDNFIDYRGSDNSGGSDNGGVVDVPEPSSILLFLLAGIGLTYRRKNTVSNELPLFNKQQGVLV